MPKVSGTYAGARSAPSKQFFSEISQKQIFRDDPSKVRYSPRGGHSQDRSLRQYPAIGWGKCHLLGRELRDGDHELGAYPENVVLRTWAAYSDYLFHGEFIMTALSNLRTGIVLPGSHDGAPFTFPER